MSPMYLCTDADPTRLYRDLAKIGQGASGGVYTAYQVGTNLSVVIKQMDSLRRLSTVIFRLLSREPEVICEQK